MILIDTGPLVAAFDPGEARHAECVKAIRDGGTEYLTTLACLTEALYLVGETRGWNGQDKLLNLIEAEGLIVTSMNLDEIIRARSLMDKYHDTPMDFADASLVVTAENTGESRIFTFDSDFAVYRIGKTKHFSLFR